MDNTAERLFSVGELFDESSRYLIPMYQRNYSWGKPEIEQLMQDILDGLQKSEATNYYLGTLVVFPRQQQGDSKVYELIDGQQRFTTLLLLLICLRNKSNTNATAATPHARLIFECRDSASNTITQLLENKHPEARIHADAAENGESRAIRIGYEEISRQLKDIQGNDDTSKLCQLSDYVRSRLKLLRVEVPPHTDVNHYFEVMNNRGEQLEKHEVLKARLMEKLDDAEQETFHRIWEACSDMNRYVQAGFSGNEPNRSGNERNRIFGEKWSKLSVDNFDDVFKSLSKRNENRQDSKPDQIAPFKLTELLHGAPQKSDIERNDDKPERFQSIIDFPNFLLHVLRNFWRSEAGSNKPSKSISLTDKTLLESFDSTLLKHTDNDAETHSTIKRFAFHLLHCRWLFDHYIIKHESTADTNGWVLKCYGKRDPRGSQQAGYWVTFGSSTQNDSQPEEQEEAATPNALPMLQAALHVSYPTKTYKYWLAGALDYLAAQTTPITAAAYLNYLNGLAKAFLFDRHLSEIPLSYDTILDSNNGKCQTFAFNNESISQKTRYDAAPPPHHFIFNYLDFLIWQAAQQDNNFQGLARPSTRQLANFRFTQRSAIEHMSPQNPKSGNAWKTDELNAFGNLCLISPSTNSSLGNDSPEEKAKHHKDDANLSLKHYLMLTLASEDDGWKPEKMQQHEQDMLSLLWQSLETEQGET